MGRQAKKLSLFNTLEVLKKYTDEDHRLTQAELLELLKQDYEMEVDRRTVKSNIMDLIELGYEIESQETTRMIRNEKTGEVEESTIMSSFYLVREFTKPELRLLIDSLLFSKHLPYSQCKELVMKLETLSNKYFRASMNYISTMPDDKTNNRQVFYNVDVLDKAIRKERKVSFKYLEYGTDKKQHHKINKDIGCHIYQPMLSPLYRLRRVKEEELTEDDHNLLELRKVVSESEEKAAKIWENWCSDPGDCLSWEQVIDVLSKIR